MAATPQPRQACGPVHVTGQGSGAPQAAPAPGTGMMLHIVFGVILLFAARNQSPDLQDSPLTIIITLSKHMGLLPNNSVNSFIGASKIKHVKMALRYTYLLGRRHCRAPISTSSVVNCLHDQNCECKSSAISTSPQTPNESVLGYRP